MSAAPPTQKSMRMPMSYEYQRGAGRPRRGGRAGRGRGEGGDAAPTQQTQGGASTSRAVEEAGTSSQAYLSPTPQTQGTTIPSTMSSPSSQAFLDALHSPGFEQLMSGMMRESGSAYRPDTQFDGSWWDSSIRITHVGCLLGHTVYGACASADSSSVTCTS
ncbi:hypothetical protein PIB30_081876 [Stylosanthes scabra]|uniref:Uncharacterized protein n=1 Tax=Stylosanthes scabra TaxID=79078 RepID=A0ABU6WQ42_9FABA|nr:hypothetical protein [Stylosanthes scabra]